MRILITGILGQDGSYLAEYCLSQNHEVWGTTTQENVSSKLHGVKLLHIQSSNQYRQLLNYIRPDQIYHLAARHFSSTQNRGIDEEFRKSMIDCNIKISKEILIWQRNNLNSKSLFALSSQMYTPQSECTFIDENSLPEPTSFYGETKLETLRLLSQFRELYGVNTRGAILFNHTSVRSKKDFLFPSLAFQLSNAIRGRIQEIYLQDPDARIDMCHAQDIVLGLYNLMELDVQTELVFSSGKLQTIKEIISNSFEKMTLEPLFEIRQKESTITPKWSLCGVSQKAYSLIGWKATIPPEDILIEQIRERLCE